MRARLTVCLCVSAREVAATTQLRSLHQRTQPSRVRDVSRQTTIASARRGGVRWRHDGPPQAGQSVLHDCIICKFHNVLLNISLMIIRRSSTPSQFRNPKWSLDLFLVMKRRASTFATPSTDTCKVSTRTSHVTPYRRHWPCVRVQGHHTNSMRTISTLRNDGEGHYVVGPSEHWPTVGSTYIGAIRACSAC